MSSSQIVATVATAIQTASKGVDFTAKHGAVCPWCGKERIPIYCTRPWSGDVRIRYHHCSNPDCLLNRLGVGVKSLQESH